MSSFSGTVQLHTAWCTSYGFQSTVTWGKSLRESWQIWSWKGGWGQFLKCLSLLIEENGSGWNLVESFNLHDLKSLCLCFHCFQFVFGELKAFGKYVLFYNFLPGNNADCRQSVSFMLKHSTFCSRRGESQYGNINFQYPSCFKQTIGAVKFRWMDPHWQYDSCQWQWMKHFCSKNLHKGTSRTVSTHTLWGLHVNKEPGMLTYQIIFSNTASQ